MILIDAIIRCTALEKTVAALESMGVTGMTITDVKGIGEEPCLYREYSLHTRLQILVRDEDEGRIVDAIVAHTNTGTQGDGVIMVHPIQRAVKIRTKQAIS